MAALKNAGAIVNVTRYNKKLDLRKGLPCSAILAIYPTISVSIPSSWIISG
jgi:hypothetical protein